MLQGRMTLLLGPPGAGKSTFLKILAGRLHATKQLRIEGDILYNGTPPSEFEVQRTVGYVDENDEHIVRLTVKDTLDFAWACQNGEISDAVFDPRNAMEERQVQRVCVILDLTCYQHHLAGLSNRSRE